MRHGDARRYARAARSSSKGVTLRRHTLIGAALRSAALSGAVGGVLATLLDFVPRSANAQPDLAEDAQRFLANARPPRFDVPFCELAYLPQRERILAVGNEGSGCDVAALRNVRDGSLPSQSVLSHHDRDEREYAHDERDRVSQQTAVSYGFSGVGRKRDWSQGFTFQT